MIEASVLLGVLVTWAGFVLLVERGGREVLRATTLRDVIVRFVAGAMEFREQMRRLNCELRESLKKHGGGVA